MITQKDLQPGDILLFRIISSSSSLDKFIGWGQHLFGKIPKKVKYCHVSLIDKDTDLMLEAKWPKTSVSKINLDELNKKYGIELYRVRKITPEQVDKVITWTHDHLDEWYNVGLFLTGWTDSKHSEICSTFVSHAFSSVGLDIPYGCSKKKLIIPDEFYLDTIGLDRIA